MQEQITDTNLARAAAQGDANAFGTLLERVYDRMFRLAFRLTGSKAEAEDLTQDICATLPAKLKSFRGEAAFTTWLSRIIINAAHDRRRRQATQSKAAQGWAAWEQNRKAAEASTREATDWLMSALAQLPDDLRDTLVLILDDMTHAQAGAALGISEGTVSWRISQARKRLAALAKEDHA